MSLEKLNSVLARYYQDLENYGIVESRDAADNVGLAAGRAPHPVMFCAQYYWMTVNMQDVRLCRKYCDGLRQHGIPLIFSASFVLDVGSSNLDLVESLPKYPPR